MPGVGKIQDPGAHMTLLKSSCRALSSVVVTYCKDLKGKSVNEEGGWRSRLEAQSTSPEIRRTWSLFPLASKSNRSNFLKNRFLRSRYFQAGTVHWVRTLDFCCGVRVIHISCTTVSV